MNRIRELRVGKGWRQEDLAGKLNTKRQSIGNYETEKRGLDVETIGKLCDIFDCTADYLLCRSSTPRPAVTEADAALLRAYHAASLRDRALVDQILAAYREGEKGESAG